MKKEYGEGLKTEYEKVCEHYQQALYAEQEIPKIIDWQIQNIAQIVEQMRDQIINKKTLGKIIELSLSDPETDGMLAKAKAMRELIDQDWAFDQKLNV